MRWEVLNHNSEVLAIHAALLPLDGGTIVYFGGDQHDPRAHDSNDIDHTRLFNCSTFVITWSESPATDVFCSGHAMLPDGRLLVAGGTQVFLGEAQPDPADPVSDHHGHFPGLRNTWIFNSVSATWQKTADMNRGPLKEATPAFPNPDPEKTGGRWYPTLTTLPDGRVLAMSGHPGIDDARHTNTIQEAFSLSPEPLGAWTILGPDDPTHQVGGPESQYFPRMHVLPNGEVFVVLVFDSTGPTSQRFDPLNNTWSTVADTPGFGLIAGPHASSPPHFLYGGYDTTSVLLPLLPEDNYKPRVLLCGGEHPQIIDPSLGHLGWTPTIARTLAGTPVRHHLSSVILPTGDIFICGGSTNDRADQKAVLAVELYTPPNMSLIAFAPEEQWTVGPSATVPRIYHSVALLMPDGRVWTAGSNHNGKYSFTSLSGDTSLPDTKVNGAIDNRELRIEIFEPDYIESAFRPTNAGAPLSADYGDVFDVHCPEAESITRIALIRTGSVTHSFNPDQRYVGLRFTMTAQDRLEVVAPPNANIAPPGNYLLFIVNAQGVPSIGTFLHVAPRRSQRGWRWCHKCQGMFFHLNERQGVCPADQNPHDASQSGAYNAIFGEEAPGQQGNWKWCHKCQGMFFHGNKSQGICPADFQSHDASQSGEYAALFGEDTGNMQGGWRFCRNCQGMFFNGNGNLGVCALDGPGAIRLGHDPSTSGHYVALFEPVLAEIGLP